MNLFLIYLISINFILLFNGFRFFGQFNHNFFANADSIYFPLVNATFVNSYYAMYTFHAVNYLSVRKKI